jgi:uncharacterized protein YdhG (YjbR/CyaY superfamily)
MKSQATTVSQYLEELPAERRAALGKLRKLVRKIAPDAVEAMQYGMPTYALRDMLFALAAQKGYLALYVCDPAAVEAHRAGLKGLNCGKGCIRFQSLEELPLDVVSAILRDAVRRRQASRSNLER